jgi:hypothetical protein
MSNFKINGKGCSGMDAEGGCYDIIGCIIPVISSTGSGKI